MSRLSFGLVLWSQLLLTCAGLYIRLAVLFVSEKKKSRRYEVRATRVKGPRGLAGVCSKTLEPPMLRNIRQGMLLSSWYATRQALQQ